MTEMIRLAREQKMRNKMTRRRTQIAIARHILRERMNQVMKRQREIKGEEQEIKKPVERGQKM